MVIGRSAKPCSAIVPRMSAAISVASGNRPIRYLVAISQADAALTKISFAGSAMASRATGDSASSPISHHSRRSEEHTSELQSPDHLVCRLLLEKKKTIKQSIQSTH